MAKSIRTLGVGKVQKISSSKAADDLTPGAYGKVREDGKASRTPLAAFLNISHTEHA